MYVQSLFLRKILISSTVKSMGFGWGAPSYLEKCRRALCGEGRDRKENTKQALKEREQIPHHSLKAHLKCINT